MVGFLKNLFANRYPIKVLVFKRYGNCIKPILDVGVTEKRTEKTPDGLVQKEYLILKKLKVKTAPVPIQFLHHVDGETWLFLYQVDRDTFWPCSLEGSNIIVYVPVTKKDEKGKEQIALVPHPLFCGDIVKDTLDNDKIKQLPVLVPNRTYSKEEWLAQEIISANSRYKSDFWDKYGNIAMTIIMMFFMIMVFYIGLSKLGSLAHNIAAIYAETSKQLAVVSDKLLQTAKLLAGKQAMAVNATAASPPY